uniref:WD_REPEATS_REGION domain-containing protein n=2 Tax=Bursaphelenchus xylophilus TaxID=6326 RepID=A0A1I7SKQ1_BURXY
ELKVWALEGDKFQLLNTESLNLGTIRSAAFCPNAPNVILVGGEKRELIKVYDIAKRSNVTDKFPDLNPTAEPEELEPNQAQEEEMDE